MERDLAEAMQRQAPQKDLANALKQYIGTLEWLREGHYRQASAEVASHIRDGDFVAAENAWNRAEKYGHDLVQQEVEGLRVRAAGMVRPHVEPGASAEEPEQTAPGGPRP